MQKLLILFQQRWQCFGYDGFDNDRVMINKDIVGLAKQGPELKLRRVFDDQSGHCSIIAHIQSCYGIIKSACKTCKIASTTQTNTSIATLIFLTLSLTAASECGETVIEKSMERVFQDTKQVYMYSPYLVFWQRISNLY